MGVVSSLATTSAWADHNLCRHDASFTSAKGNLLVAANPSGVQAFINAATLANRLPSGIVQEMLWADFDGDGYSELALAIAHYSSPTLPPDSTDVFVMDGPENVYLVGTFPGQINDIAAGTYHWTDTTAKLAIARNGTPGDPVWDWGAAVIDPYTGEMLAKKSYAGAQPRAVALGDLFGASTLARELFIGVADRVDVVSSDPIDDAGPPSITFQTGGGAVISLEAGHYDTLPDEVLVVGRETRQAETDGHDDLWKVAVLTRGKLLNELKMPYRYGWGFVGNVGLDPLGAIDVNTQPVLLKLGDMNNDGVNELAVATYTKVPESSETANLIPRTWLLVYSEKLPHAEDEPGWGAEDQFVGQTVRMRTVGRPTGLAFADTNGDGKNELAVSMLRRSTDPLPGLGTLSGSFLGCAKVASVLGAECSGIGLNPLALASEVVPTPDDTFEQAPLPYVGVTSVAGTSLTAIDNGQWSATKCVHGDDTCNGLDDDQDGVVDDDVDRTMGEALDGVDNDCNNQIDEIGTFDCSSNPSDWRCCAAPTVDTNGIATYPQLTFIVDRLDDALSENDAAAACVPVSQGPSSGCTLRGVVRRAEQLRFVAGKRQACEVVALLGPGNHALTRRAAGPTDFAGYSFLRFGGGRLTLRGTGPGAIDTRITRAAVEPYRLIASGQLAPAADEAPEGATLTVQNLTLENGLTYDAFTTEWGGGAIRGQGGTVVVDHAVLQNNEAKQEGGALQMEDGTLVVQDSVLRHNVTVKGANNARGGAIWVRSGNLKLLRSAIVGNYADGGSGVAVAGGTATIVNNTFSKNVCEDEGCGLQLISGVQATLGFNTIVDNRASGCGGAGLGVGLSVGSATLAAYGNVIAGNRDVKHAPSDCSGATEGSAGHNLVGVNDPATCPLFSGPDALVGNATMPLDPKLLELPGYLEPNLEPGRSCGPGPTDSFIDTDPSVCDRRDSTLACNAICAGAATPEQCVMQLGLIGPAVGAFGSAASTSGAADACPAVDQRGSARPTAGNCSLGAVDVSVTAKGFSNIAGSNIITVPSSGTPSFELRLAQLETPQNIGDNYGLRVSGRVRAPLTGQYRFFIAGDDNVSLYLSSDQTSLNKQRIAYHEGYTGFREWTKYATQKSALISLVAGELYYIEAVLKEAQGLDGLSVGWLKPGDSGSTPSQIVPLDFPALVLPHGSGSINEEKWHGISGTSVSSIPLSSTPDFVGSRASFEGFSNVADNYGARLRGWVTAPLSGPYTFWISGDDNVALYLSTDGGPESKQLIASHSGHTTPYEWNKYASQKSQPVQLVAGRSYYIEALLKEGSQDDHVEVGWLLPGQTGNSPSQVIPGSQLSPYFPPAPKCSAQALPRMSASASSQEAASYPASAAIDGNPNTRWSSQFWDPQWLIVDLGQVQFVKRVKLTWETAASADYDIRVSNDGANWTTVYTDAYGNGGIDDISTLSVAARYVKVYSRSRVTSYGNSLWEVEVFGDPLETCDPR